MRWIPKTDEPPAPLHEFLEVQLLLHINLDYASFSRRTELRQALIAEQGGLCAFTGAPIDDDRIGSLQAAVDATASTSSRRRKKKEPQFKSHIAHIKPQAVLTWANRRRPTTQTETARGEVQRVAMTIFSSVMLMTGR